MISTNLKTFLKKNWKIIFGILYLLFPADIIPDIIPFLGVSDDLVILLGTLILQYLQHKRNTNVPKSRTPKMVEGELVK